jgi:nucleoside-diphosphate-sugar epimerase
MPRRNWNKVFITGGTSFIGLRVVAALVNAGADVTVLVRPDHEEKLGALRRHVRLMPGDVWNSASLKGRARGHGVVVHLVGSLRAQPERGLTFQQLNLVSARNVIGMAVGDGVPLFVFLSAASNPAGVSREYLRNKREAEDYLRTSGLAYTIVRAPMLFNRQQRGGGFFSTLSWIGALPFLRVFSGRRAPLPVDVAARGIARLALQDTLPRSQIVYAGNLRRLARPSRTLHIRGRVRLPRRRQPVSPPFGQEDDTPFGWLPDQLPSEDE